MELNNNHISLAATEDMRTLSSPLKMLHVDFFSYTRFYWDGTSISLLTHTDWYKAFLEQEVPGCINVFNLQTGCHLWSEIYPEQAVMEAKTNFKIDNGYKQEEYVEVFSFASKLNDNRAIGYFIANIDLLEKFSQYFKNTLRS